MSLDQYLLLLLAFAALYRYHRNETSKAEERFERCDAERIRLHDLCYSSMAGVGFTDTTKTPEPIVEQETDTADSRFQAAVQREKLELKRIARSRISQLGPALRKIEKRSRPSIHKMRPTMDPTTASNVAEQIRRQFNPEEMKREISQKVANGGIASTAI